MKDEEEEEEVGVKRSDFKPPHWGMQSGYARVRQTASEAGLLGQDMMSKLGDSVC